MSFLKKALGALVEMDNGDAADPAPDKTMDSSALEKELAEIRKLTGAPTPAASSPPPTAAPTSTGTTPAPTSIVEGVAFSDIYAKANVPSIPYTADMLLNVVDKLRAMPREQVIQMVNAMDDADDRWTVGDVLNDANLKRNALQGQITALGSTLKTAEETCNAKVMHAQTQLEAITTEIKAQIAALEQTLAEAKQEADQDKVAATAQLAATREAHARETARLGAEFERLGRLQSTLK
jgi:hypothetical protein